MTDERLVLAREALESRLKQQDQNLQNVRNRAMVVLSAAAVSVSLALTTFGMAKKLHIASVIALIVTLVLFAALCGLAVTINWPVEDWTFYTSGAKVTGWVTEGWTIDRINEEVVKQLIAGRNDNDKTLSRFGTRFRILSVLLALVVIGGSAAVVTGR